MQRKDVEILAKTCSETGHNHVTATEVPRVLRALLAERDALQGQLNDLRNGWANSVKAHATLLAERDAAFAAGQEEMRERVIGETTATRAEDATRDRIRALPIKPRS